LESHGQLKLRGKNERNIHKEKNSMSASALVTMIGAWTIIAYYTIKFFVKVLNIPQEKDGGK